MDDEDEKDAKDWHIGTTIIINLLQTAADRENVIVFHIQNYSRTLTEYKILKSGMKSKRNLTYSALYIINAVGVKQGVRIIEVLLILNRAYNMLGLANFSSVIIVISNFVLLCWFDVSYFMVWSFASWDPLVTWIFPTNCNLSLILLFILSS